MKINELFGKLKVFQAKIKLKQTGYSTLIDVTVNARNPEMARRLLRQLYGDKSMITNVKEIKVK